MSSATSPTVFVLNGPNLNMLGRREPDVYGSFTLEDIRAEVVDHGRKLGLTVDFRQSNSEAELVGWIQEAADGAAGLIVNAGAYTHTSVALLDALKAVQVPAVEVHLSNIFAREEFRKESYVSRAAVGVICGFGPSGYLMALDALANIIKDA